MTSRNSIIFFTRDLQPRPGAASTLGWGNALGCSTELEGEWIQARSARRFGEVVFRSHDEQDTATVFGPQLSVIGVRVRVEKIARSHSAIARMKAARQDITFLGTGVLSARGGSRPGRARWHAAARRATHWTLDSRSTGARTAPIPRRGRGPYSPGADQSPGSARCGPATPPLNRPPHRRFRPGSTRSQTLPAGLLPPRCDCAGCGESHHTASGCDGRTDRRPRSRRGTECVQSE